MAASTSLWTFNSVSVRNTDGVFQTFHRSSRFWVPLAAGDLWAHGASLSEQARLLWPFRCVVLSHKRQRSFCCAHSWHASGGTQRNCLHECDSHLGQVYIGEGSWAAFLLSHSRSESSTVPSLTDLQIPCSIFEISIYNAKDYKTSVKHHYGFRLKKISSGHVKKMINGRIKLSTCKLKTQ